VSERVSRGLTWGQYLQEYFDLGDLYTLDINGVLEDDNRDQTPIEKVS